MSDYSIKNLFGILNCTPNLFSVSLVKSEAKGEERGTVCREKKKNKAEDVEDQIEGTEIADEERDGSRVKKDGNMNWSCLKGRRVQKMVGRD